MAPPQTHTRDLVVVTGASTGMGAATAAELAAQGFHVLAGVRQDADAQRIAAPGVEPVILDITRREHIEALTRRLDEEFSGHRLHALVNNAGISVNAPVEAFGIDQWRQLLEVNLLGHIAVTQTLLPRLIGERGRVVNISSVGGRIAMATYGPYASAKWGIEAVSDALRRELRPLGVPVVVVEPGAVATAMGGRGTSATTRAAASMPVDLQQRYGRLVQAVVDQTRAHMDTATSAQDAALIIVEAVTARRPRTRYTIGRDAAAISLMTRLLPDRALDLVLELGLRPHLGVDPSVEEGNRTDGTN